VITARANGFNELSEYFSVVKGECLSEFKMVKKSTSKMIVTALDVSTGVPTQGVLLKVFRPK
jgi:hypothetical protein